MKCKNCKGTSVKTRTNYSHGRKSKAKVTKVCRNCGSIVDFESKPLTDYSFRIIERLKGFSADSTSTSFYGICKKCGG